MSAVLQDKCQSLIGHQILSYLIDHPEAQDTLEGISQWWILEREIRWHQTQVENALKGLVLKGFIVERKGLDSQYRYQINKRKIKEIQKYFSRNDGTE